MKKISLIFMLTVIGFAPVAQGQEVEETDPGFVIMDVLVYRPLGLAATVVGTSLFVAMSPLTAIASIPKPHDAFEKVGKILVITPATDTFVRPLGNRAFVADVMNYQRKPAQLRESARPQLILPKPSAPMAPNMPRPMPPNPGATTNP